MKRGSFDFLKRCDFFDLDLCDPRIAEAERIGSTGRHIKNPTAHKGAAIIHRHMDAALIGEIGDAQNRAKGQMAMRGG